MSRHRLLKNKLSLLLLGAVLGFIALALLGSFIKTRLVCSETVEACVVDINEVERTTKSKKTHKTEVYYYPVYEYVIDGNTFVKKSSSGSNYVKYVIGDKVNIRYNPDNPNEFDDSRFAYLIMGSLFMTGSVLMIITGSKYKLD